MKPVRLLKSLPTLLMLASMTVSMVACSTNGSSGAAAGSQGGSVNAKYADTITVVWYPNESASDFEPARKHFEDLIAQATGKKVSDKTTTDYNIAIEALASGQAQIGAYMGALGYIQAKQENTAVSPLFVNTGASGTLDDAVYYSRICVMKGQEQNYMKDGQYTIDNIAGKKMSFVSNSSTSGFLFPTTSIVNHFKAQDKWKDLKTDDLAQGGSDKFFSDVLFGGSHQGSAANLLAGKVDVAAFDDTDVANYVEAVSGDVKTPGSVFKVKDGAKAPFDTLVGKQFVILQALPVLNGPFAYNSGTLSPDDAKAIQKLMTSDTVTNDEQMFAPDGSSFKGILTKDGKSHFVVVEDSWYDAIRKIMA